MQDTPTWKKGQSLQSFIRQNFPDFHLKKSAQPRPPKHIRLRAGRRANGYSTPCTIAELPQA